MGAFVAGWQKLQWVHDIWDNSWGTGVGCVGGATTQATCVYPFLLPRPTPTHAHPPRTKMHIVINTNQ